MAAPGARGMEARQVRDKVVGASTVDQLTEKADRNGQVRIIVTLAERLQVTAPPETPELKAQLDSISRAQGALMRRLDGKRISLVHKFSFVPQLVTVVDAEALKAVLESDLVKYAEEDVAVPATLDFSVPGIGAPFLWSLGYKGAGTTVAILDTGVDKNHPFLSGKMVSEACYSMGAMCPGGVTESTAVGSALPYGGNCPPGQCDHGTHVAGIAAGKENVNGSPGPGVAPQANLIAIQIFSRFDNAGDCSPEPAPCIKTFTSDQIRGLERVYDLRSSFNIAAVNMSIGGGQYAYCDSDSRKLIIDSLKAAGIATIISSGNDNYCGAVSAPGCISSAVTVGATTDSDAVADYSNSAAVVDVLAPGSSIVSSVPGVGYDSWDGTSMAAPHVTGAWALLKEAWPLATVDQILLSLTSTGPSITDSTCPSMTKRRVDATEAFNVGVRAFKLPDSDQRKCYQAEEPYAEIPCAGTGQDGAYLVNPLNYTDNGDGTVTDNNTGLTWQQEESPASCNWYQASGTYDATYNPASESTCGALALAGHSDWRLPSRQELMSIVNYNLAGYPTIDTGHFPDARGSGYWSSTADAGNHAAAWQVHFDGGGVSAGLKEFSADVRCVRGDRDAQWLTDNGNETVTDSHTGLIWQQAEPGTMTWGAALEYCSGLSLASADDWRLPNQKELDSLVDDSRYNPSIDTARFPNAQASSYWSSTSSAWRTSEAGAVSFNSGEVTSDQKDNSSVHVRCVRGGRSGKPPNPSIAMTPMAGSAGTTFRRSGSGFTPFSTATLYFTDTDGNTSLLSQPIDAAGRFSLPYTAPTNIPEGHYAWWAKDISGMTADRISYTITTGHAGGNCRGAMWGKVVDLTGSPIAGARADLRWLWNETVVDSVTTDSNGRYSFFNLPCGTYQVGASYTGEGVGDFSASATRSVIDGLPLISFDIQLPVCSASQQRVVLIPGIMGSTCATQGLIGQYPALPFERPAPGQDLQIHKAGAAGWRDLEHDLTAAGICSVECPWDWRLSPDRAAEEYLVPAIEKALANSVNGKVDIVAHGAGGLVARALIQSGNLLATRIGKLLTAGTPHLGSTKPYFLWEGGDPNAADELDGNAWNFRYATAVKTLWENAFDKKDNWDPERHAAIQRFIRQEARLDLLRDMMATDAFLTEHDLQSGPWRAPSDAAGGFGNRSLFLQSINDGDRSGYLSRLSPDGVNNTIKLGLIAGIQAENATTEKIMVGTVDQSRGLYPDGTPSAMRRGRGDGTVTEASATHLSTHGNLLGTFVAGHSSLVRAAGPAILNFVGEQPTAAMAPVMADLTAQTEETPAPVLAVNVGGAMRLLVSDPQGLRGGIDRSTNAPVEEIPGLDMAFGYDGGGLAITGPVAGRYTVTLFGVSGKDFQVSVGLAEAEAGEDACWRGFSWGNSITFTVDYAPGASPRLLITPPYPGVTGLQATPYDSAGKLLTRLAWDAVTAPGLTGYGVYVRSGTSAGYSHLVNVGPDVTALETNIPWTADAAILSSAFAVTALATDAESFFPRPVLNDDRDGDGLSDVDEANYGTDINNPDTDGDGCSDGWEVNHNSDPLDVTSPAPQAADDQTSTAEDTPVTPALLGNDIAYGGDVLSVTAVTQGTNGSVVTDGVSVTYTPRGNFFGSDSFAYTIGDGHGGADTATATISVYPVNDPPDFTKGADVTVPEDAAAQAVSGWASGIRAGPANESGQVLTFSVTGNTNLGLFSAGPAIDAATGDLTFTPAMHAYGTATISIALSDNGGTAHGGTDISASQSFTIEVTSVNDPPAAVDDAAATDEDTPAHILVLDNDTDVDGDPLSITSVTQGVNGSVIVDGASVVYVPADNFFGSDSFTYTIEDGQGGTDAATVTITVNPVNDPPVAADEAAVTNEDVPLTISVLDNDTDLDGDTLSVTDVTQGANGLVTTNGTTVTYTPNADWHGEDSFTYTVSDGRGGTATAAVTMTVIQLFDISGRVWPYLGAPLRRVTMTLRGGSLVKVAFTNRLGQYRLTDVPAGSYLLKPRKAGWYFRPWRRRIAITASDLIRQNFTATPR